MQWHLIPSIFLGMFMKEFGVLNQSQVEGLEQLLAFIELDPDVTDIRWAAFDSTASFGRCPIVGTGVRK